MNARRCVLRLLVMVAVSVCAGCIAPSAPLQKRWAERAKDDTASTWAGPELWVGPFSSEAQSLSVKDLGDHAQAAYIQELAKLSKGDADTLRAAIAKKISPSKPMLDTTDLNRTLLITVGKRSFEPADRLVRTLIALEPVGFTFSDLEAAATTYSTVNVETVSASNSTTGGFELGPSVAGTAKITGGFINTATDQASINQQVEQLTVYKTNEKVMVYRESERGLDLTGNTLLRIGLQHLATDDIATPNVVTDAKLVDDKGRWRTPDEASLTIARAKFVKPHHYCVRATLTSILRHVEKGPDTYTESDDGVRFDTKQKTDTFELVPPRELQINRWQLRQGGAVLRVSNVVDAGGATYPIEFTDFETAVTLQDWIRAHGGPVLGGRRLGLGIPGDATTSDLPAHASLELVEVPHEDPGADCHGKTAPTP